MYVTYLCHLSAVFRHFDLVSEVKVETRVVISFVIYTVTL